MSLSFSPLSLPASSRALVFSLALFSINSVYASNDLKQLANLNQAEFNRLSADLTAATSYKGLIPATALGITGFDLAAELSSTQLDDSAVWHRAGGSSSTLLIPKIHLHKGLPNHFDVGVSLASLSSSSTKIFGAEVRYALMEGSAALPALAVRGSLSRLSGASNLDAQSQSLELIASKGFVMFTPYAGVGRVWGKVTPQVSNLSANSVSQNKLFAGLNANFGLVNLAGEVDRTGNTQSLSFKLGFRW